MTVEACNHPQGEIMQPSEVVRVFGPTAVNLVPRYPGYGQLQRDREGSSGPVYLSRLVCGHFLLSSPVIAAAAKEASEERTPLEFARLSYQILLEKAHAGEEVSAAEVATAQAAIMVEERAAEGRRERQEAARVQAERERGERLEGPLRDELVESAENAQGARDNAFQALMALLDAVEDDMDVHNHVLTVLSGAGLDEAEVRPPARGYVHQTRVKGESFPFFPKMEHLIAVLHAVQVTRHRNGFNSTNGRDFKKLPSPVEGGPRVSPDVIAEGMVSP